MRLRIEIDDQLMASAVASGDFKTPKEAVEEGLRRIARGKIYQNIRELRGKLHWSLDGDWTEPEHSAQEPRRALSARSEKQSA